MSGSDEVLPERVRVWVDKSVEDTEVETRDLSFGWVHWDSIRSVLIDSDGDCEVWEG